MDASIPATPQNASVRSRSTHAVTNQPPPLAPYDARANDAALTDAYARFVGADPSPQTTERLTEIGHLAGSEQARDWAFQANRNPPVLRTHDRYGHRIDEVEFHPAWHTLMDQAVGFGMHGAPWTSGEPDAHLTRAAGYYLWHQVEAGHCCPITMTYAAVPALRASDELSALWTPLLTARSYDPGLRAPATKGGALAGMGMTEKQGGSDVRANTTRAEATGDGTYVLTGHKWFCSAPMCDVFLVLAQAAGGLSCFVVPRVLPDGSRNPFALQRLKDKLGNRSNASSEVEFDGTVGWLLGDEGRGVPTIIEMVAATRLDCVLGSAAQMRKAVAEATWHAAHRSAFGAVLADQPAMTNVLADLAVEQEAATWLALRLAHAVDAGEQAFLRLALPLGKYLVCKRTPWLVAEALECLGGNGYVEDSGLPMLFRESPLNSLWEGSGSVQALDVLRALQREPEALEAYLSEIGAARGADARLDAATDEVLRSLADLESLEFRARRMAERLALVLQGSLLVRHAPAAVADAFCASRLGRDAGGTFGTLPVGVDAKAIVERATPRR
ncbi:acyl-CoA dehydrogenase family protein [Tenggerimyces flavus]|uniref:Acyl-CoA dehydrogenase family protein n=1 Tax=Tenggerimyces flavus TaxID=1708749 RepID=A0ABV7YEQ1_9ACTN|nr:acyl-CoA dehydrogenase family protein [Tenggerimyces flavus]MBM7787826.1 putative acyl-CoA dehydrogenase [Tenggerimyces flavus]